MLCDAKARPARVSCAVRARRRRATDRALSWALGLDIIPGTGLLPACVPGTFETYMMILRDHGTLRLRDVLEPAMPMPRNGHPLVERASLDHWTVEGMFARTGHLGRRLFGRMASALAARARL